MKKMLLFTGILVFIGMTGLGQPKKFRDIVGHWNITGEQNAGASLQIIDSSVIILTYMGEKKSIIDYKIDFTKSPIWFDFSTKDSTSTLLVKSLLQILGDDMIKWQIFIDEDRPNHFSSSKGELFYLKKSKSNATAVMSN